MTVFTKEVAREFASRVGADRREDASLQALRAAEALVTYIKFFRTHGTGECMAKYPDDETFGGYDNIVRRAKELADAIDGFDGRSHKRRAA